MAETLDVNQMLANHYEPKRKFQWILQLDGIDAMTAKTAARPKKEHEEITIDYINEKRYLAGKGAWGVIRVELYDPISPSQTQKVMELMRLIHDDSTGRMGYSVLYKQNFTLKLLGPDGTVVEKWTAKGGWIKNVDFSDLDYASSDAVTVSFDLRADKWILNF